MPTSLRWTTADLTRLSDAGKRYAMSEGDVVRISKARVATGLDAAGSLIGAPRLAGKELAPDAHNARRARGEAEVVSPSRIGEYWSVDWMRHQLEVNRRGQVTLRRIRMLFDQDQLCSPVPPGSVVRVEQCLGEIKNM
jgi:hypothetical protein